MSFIEKLAAGVSGFSRGVQVGQGVGYQIGGGPQAEQQRELRAQRRREIQQLYSTSPAEAIKAAEQEGFAGLASAYKSDQQRQAGVMRAGITMPQTLGTGGVGDLSPESLKARREGLIAAQTGLGTLEATYGTTMSEAELGKITKEQQEIQERINAVNSFTQAISNLQQVTDYPTYQLQEIQLQEALKTIDPDVARGVIQNYRKQFDAKARTNLIELMTAGATIPADFYIASKDQPIVDAYIRAEEEGLALEKLGAFGDLIKTGSLFNDPTQMESFIRERGGQLGLSEDNISDIISKSTRSIRLRKNETLFDTINDLNLIVERGQKNFLLNGVQDMALETIANSFGVSLSYVDQLDMKGKKTGYKYPTSESIARLADAIVARDFEMLPQSTAINDGTIPSSSINSEQLRDIFNRLEEYKKNNNPKYDQLQAVAKSQLEDYINSADYNKDDEEIIKKIIALHAGIPDVFAAEEPTPPPRAVSHLVGSSFLPMAGGAVPSGTLNKPPKGRVAAPTNTDTRVATGKPN